MGVDDLEGERGGLNQQGSTSGDRKESEESTVKSATVPYHKLFFFADTKDVVLMVIGFIASLGNGMAMPLMTILIGSLTDAFGQNANTDNTLHEVSQEGNTGEVVGRMSGDTVLIQDAMGEKVGKFIQLFTTFVGGFVIAFIKGWLLTLVLLSSIPLLVICGAVFTMFLSKMTTRGQAAYGQAGSIVERTFGSIRTVASFTGEKHAISDYEKSLTSAYESGVKEGMASGIGFGAIMLIIFSTYALAIWYGGKLILEKGYTGGDVINVIVAVLTGSMSLGQASPSFSAFAAGQAAAYKMFETINRKPDIDAYDTSGRVLDDINGNIELRDVHFSYPARPEEQIFRGFSLYIPSGTTAALVGQSGSGKSTVISLIERFYDPQAGEVLIDNINLKEFQLKWIRQKIGLVSQEPALFASSIRDNIAYGKDGATVEEIRAAAELANAAKFIDKLPQQRVAIARAILKDPRILLLDEATSALDAESERIVQEALDRIMVNRTTVIVAHRLSTVRNADMIAVIQQGKIVEKGSHSELLKDPDGAFCQLVRLQEVNKESRHKPVGEDDRSEGGEIGRSSSQRLSLRSLSRTSSGVGNSSRHSFTVSFGLPMGHVQKMELQISNLLLHQLMIKSKKFHSGALHI
ncbi:hypothetical protein Syun_008207 [Stephania yunnanensis]|uniref:Uncharacterized protein n=1 Tax=Stephania yunnanensis TaxID=152371 RepID=A0AAP0L058_9MAGN